MNYDKFRLQALLTGICPKCCADEERKSGKLLGVAETRREWKGMGKSLLSLIALLPTTTHVLYMSPIPHGPFYDEPDFAVKSLHFCYRLPVVRVFVPMWLLAGRGVLLCSTLGCPVLLSAVCIGVYVVLHLLCGDWPSLWSIGLTMFLRVPTQHSWPLMLPHCSITSGRSYRRSLWSVFPHVTALLVHHLLHTEHLTVSVSLDCRSVC